MNEITYKDRVFKNKDLVSGDVHLAGALMSSSLEPNTMSFEVRSDDTTLTAFRRNDPVLYNCDGTQVGRFYLQSVERTGRTFYKFTATSAIGLLMEGLHYGGIYTGQTVEEVLPGIMGAVPYYIKSNLKPVKLYGWLPVAAPRDNLSQVLFAIGATVKTDLDGFLRIESFWDSVSSLTGKDRIYSGAKVGYSPTVTQVVVTEHQYAESQESEQLFEGTTAAGDIVTFNEPMHGLTAAGFSILDSGANWAKLSAGSGTLTGKKYLHNTRQISRTVGTAETPNIKKVENATLISLVNSQATAERLANYYKWLETVDAAVVYRGEKPGDRVQVWHPYDNVETTACLQSADITLSNVLKAQEKALVGYVPPLPEAVVTYDNRAMLTGSGTWNVPAGVTMMRAVLIGGGQGGQGGFNGEPGADGRSASPIKGSYSSGAGGAGGKGGERGAGGQGGKVLIADITIPEGVTALTYTCGAGGAGGASNGGTGTFGGETSLRMGDATFSTAQGAASAVGYSDIQTGEAYAVQGVLGVNGGDGGDGSEYTGNSAPTEDFAGKAGQNVSGGQGAWGSSATAVLASSQCIDDEGNYSGYPEFYEGIDNTKERSIEVELPFTLTGGDAYTFKAESTWAYFTITGSKSVTLTEDSFSFGGNDISLEDIFIPADASNKPGMIRKFTTASRVPGENKAILNFVSYCIGVRTGSKEHVPLVYGNGGNGGGGAAFNVSVERYNSNGANGPALTAQTTAGNGGHGGHGGGGGGGGGGGYVWLDRRSKGSGANKAGNTGGAGGAGSAGGAGGPGCVILYYGIPHITSSGWLKTRDGKFFNGRLRRRFIV